MLNSCAIKATAHRLGFDLCGVARAAAHPELAHLETWLARGYAGSMEYLRRSAACRVDPRRLLPSARSVIVVGVCYNTDRPHTLDLACRDRALVSRHGWGEDYHRVIRERLTALVAWMDQEAGGPLEACISVDAGAVQEKVLARHAGLGWIGKHTLVINPEYGSWVLLGVVLCNLDLEPDEPASDRCGSCTRCLEVCPTGAIVAPRLLDASRCVSYLTIEQRGAIPRDLRPSVGQHIYGCDLCQEVCPWNSGAPVSRAAAWQPRPGLDRPPLATLWALDDDQLRALVSGSAIARIGADRLRRNLAVAIGNSDDPRAAELLKHSASRHGALVTEHITGALEELRARGLC